MTGLEIIRLARLSGLGGDMDALGHAPSETVPHRRGDVRKGGLR